MPGLECVSSRATYEGKFVLAALLPAIVGVLALLVWLAGVVLRKRTVRRRATIVFVFLWLTFLLSFVRRIFAVFNCSTHGVDTDVHGNALGPGFLTDGMWIECRHDADNNWHAMFVTAATFGVVSVVGTLVAQVVVTWRARNADPASMSTTTTFLVSPYKPEVYFWETVITLRRVLIGLTLALSSYGSVLLPAGVFVLLFISLQCSALLWVTRDRAQ